MDSRRDRKNRFLQELLATLSDGEIQQNRRSVEKLAMQFGIANKIEVKEYVELSIVLKARQISQSSLPLPAKYSAIVELYNNQVNLSFRTSHSILLQQYSTPAPISFLAGIYVNADQGISVFEPSAGNGLLTIAADPRNVVVNEIDDLRNSNLQDQGYKKVLKQDATKPFRSFEKKFDAVITNPPFGRHEKVMYETYPITTLEHLMALRALDTMKDSGKAAIIIGGHNRYDKLGRFQKGAWRYFFNYLYNKYHVTDLINIDGHKLYSRQGTSFDVRLILIAGRKKTPGGAAPVANEERDKVVTSFEELYERVINQTTSRQEMKNNKTLRLRAKALEVELALLNLTDELGYPYVPASEACNVLDTVVPDSMAYESHEAVYRIKEEVGGDVDEYVRKKLNYNSKIELCKALSAEQIDAVALAIYNIEERGQGMIIGDQTGIGKGRVAASIIRYGVHQGVKPIFLTEKANLFSDIYRDLSAIGSGNLVPFIVNAKESKTDIKDEDGNVVYEALPQKDQENIFSEQRVPASFHFVVATYSQFNSPEKKPLKPFFLQAIAEDNIMILDEAHNSSGSGNTGTLMQSVIADTRGVAFLSATFAKRPDNMPLYAMKTAISEASMTKDALVDAIVFGGVALQEILASQLVAEGQMIRRERSFEGVEVNYITLDEKEQEHKAISDNITEIIRLIISFQKDFVNPEVEARDEIAVAEGKQVDLREGTNQAGVDNMPYFSKVFNIINQMLFSIKAEAVAERAVMRLKEGKKPVIAFSSTMGSFIEQMENDRGLPVSDGDIINADFATVLQKGLDGVLRYSVTEPDGSRTHKTFDLSELPIGATAEYNRISSMINEVSSGITISPIDVIIERIEDAGYTVAEVTGRKLKVQFRKTDKSLGIVQQQKFKRGDKVVHRKSGKSGVVEYAIQKGDFVPGQDNTNNYSYEYSIKLENGNSFSFDESELAFKTTTATTGLVLSRKRENTNDAFRRFNNNEVDVLLINQSGSTGASAHAIPTAKVPKDKVKQRVMIVLQAELDISTEVQKRGRINRTGQLHKPIYDYVNSAIPAEQRLMMMLQKKLKSLDANTTSNQKSSTKILDVPDFLNKYGDVIVEEYLRDNPAVNDLLDDPLKFESEAEPVEEAAHKVSGRVAVLSSQMQQDFYVDVSTRYNEYVEYLKQTGEYDLEVEAMDLAAETMSRQVIIVGKGGKTAFGDDSILETVKANVLRKPFTTSELANLLRDGTQNKTPDEAQRILLNEFTGYMEERLKSELEENRSHYQDLLLNVGKEKKLLKIQQKQGEDAYQAAIQSRRKELTEAEANAAKVIETSYKNRQDYLTSIFNFFYVGRNLNYPMNNFDSGVTNILAVFLGFVIDKKKKNPYTPSNIKLRFAVASGTKYLMIPTSYTKDVNAIRGASIELETGTMENTIALWDETIKSSAVDRKIRHIITGNILQAFAAYKGKLVSYTTLDGSTKKGILMPESWLPSPSQTVVVPIIRAVKVIKSLTNGAQITTTNNISIFRQPQGFKIILSASRSQAGDIFLDENLLKLVNNSNFEKTSNKMVASVEEQNIEKFIDVLQTKFNVSITLTAEQFNLIKDELPDRPIIEAKKFVMPQPRPQQREPVKSPSTSKVKLLQLRARALELELALLSI